MMDGNDRSALQLHFDAATSKKTLSIDVERYQHMLDELGLSEEQKDQFLEALWSIIIAYVDLGFEVHPAQEVCGKDEKALEEQDKNARGALNSEASSQIIDDHDAPRS
ncbi:hypothetical protein ACFSUD_19150 [Sulfitobacter aestuarii]|uniref:Uncharacterized protein n=1 Tax=Sulfitobacter aestuarii TaxID=2161676 RepID=A0ABW5U782_9RHOB